MEHLMRQFARDNKFSSFMHKLLVGNAGINLL